HSLSMPSSSICRSCASVISNCLQTCCTDSETVISPKSCVATSVRKISCRCWVVKRLARMVSSFGISRLRRALPGNKKAPDSIGKASPLTEPAQHLPCMPLRRVRLRGEGKGRDGLRQEWENLLRNFSHSKKLFASFL